MNLFTYLLAKNDKFSLVHKGDLFSYLLGKNNSIPLKTAEGVSITIEALKTKINELKMTKESTQDGTPTPENPIEVKTVKGYRNLFDKDNANIINGFFDAGKITSSSTAKIIYTQCEPNTIYTMSKIVSARFQLAYSTAIPTIGGNVLGTIANNTANSITITTGDNAQYLVAYIYSSSDTLSLEQILNSIMITEGTSAYPYVPYGNNYVYTKVSNGTNNNYYTIPLNGNEIAGIGDYKDELIVDKNGKCWLNKKIGKVVLDGTENWERNADGEGYYRLVLSINNTISVANDDNITRALSNYFVGESAGNVIVTNPTKNMIGVISNNRIMVNTIDTNLFSINSFKTWLSTHNTDVYYVLATENLIDLNYDVDIRLFNGVNHISNSDDMNMTLIYK